MRCEPHAQVAPADGMGSGLLWTLPHEVGMVCLLAEELLTKQDMDMRWGESVVPSITFESPLKQ